MRKFVAKRLGLGVLTLFLVSVVVFAGTQTLPGDAAKEVLGKNATPSAVASLRRELNLDESKPEQYLDWLGGVLGGDLGTSLATREPVTELIGARLENSAFLVMIAALITVPLALGLGIGSAIKRDTPADHGLQVGLLSLAALPEFVIGIALILLLATSLFQLLPAVSLLNEGQHPWEVPEIVVLPALTLALAVVPYVARIMRGSMIEVLESEYVQMARLKGLSERYVIFRHALPNALAPAVQVVALQLAWMAGGVVLVEYVFQYPGIGTALVDAVANRDLPVVQAISLIIAATYVVLNLAADVATVLLSPRARTATTKEPSRKQLPVALEGPAA